MHEVQKQYKALTGLTKSTDLKNGVVADQLARLGLPPLKWSSAMFRKTEEDHGQQATKARRDCHEVTAG